MKRISFIIVSYWLAVSFVSSQTLDNNFNVNLGSGFDGAIHSVICQTNGKVLLGGLFSTLNGNEVPDYFLRLNTNGALDTAFTNNLGSGFGNSFLSRIFSVLAQPNGKILVGGFFTTLGNIDVPDYFIRLNGDGSLDTMFNSKLGVGFSAPSSIRVQALALQSDGKILVGGNFTTLSNLDVADRLVRLNSDGTLDTAFNNNLALGFNDWVYSLAVQTNGQILVGGNFTTLNNGNIPSRFVRLHANGTLDAAFNGNLGVGFDNVIRVISLQSNGKILLGGEFSTLNNVTVPRRLIRLNTNGTVDLAFTNNLGSGFSGGVYSLAFRPNGQILVGGDFTNLNNANVSDRLLRLNNDGTLDVTFTNILGSGFNGIVHSLNAQTNGQILVAGDFTTLNGANIPDRLIRFHEPTLTNIIVTPGEATILVNAGLQFTALGQYNDGNANDISSQVSWTSSDTNVALINNMGLVNGFNPGTTTIRASYGILFQETSLNVIRGGNSGNFANDHMPDILGFKKGELKILDIHTNLSDSIIGPLNIPKPARVLAGNRVANTNYIVFQQKNKITIALYSPNNTLDKLDEFPAATLPKTFGKVKASGDINQDEIIDLIGVKKNTVQVLYGPDYSKGGSVSNLVNLVTNKRLPGKVVGMYSTNGVEWILVFQKKQSTSHYAIDTNLKATSRSGLLVSGKIMGLSGSTPILQKGKTITAGKYSFRKTGTSNVGRVVGPK